MPLPNRTTVLALTCTSLLAGASLLPEGATREERFLTSRSSGVTLKLPPDDPGFTFAVFGDRTGGPASGIHVLEQAVSDTNLLAPDLVMTVGDLIQGYNQTPAWMAQMIQYHGAMSALDMPWYPVAGNHDVYWRGDGRPEGEHEANYEQHFGPLWYAFEHEGSWFVVLYSDEGNPETGAKSFNDPANQRMSDEQFAWLDQTLTRTADGEHVFVFLHHPRWLEGGYGDDWRRVHARLAEAGNVRAVFAGHIHHMRYDGIRDGIEYFTLATVGGHAVGDVDRAGFLDQFHMVTVRESGIAVAAVPVGAPLDARAVTGTLSDDVRAISARLRPVPQVDLLYDARAESSFALPLRFQNPTARPVEVTWRLDSPDFRWRTGGRAGTLRLDGGASQEVTVELGRPADSLDADFDLPELVWQVDYEGEERTIASPERRAPVELVLTGFPESPDAARLDGAFAFDGRGDALLVPSERLRLHDGPFTVETWMRADRFDERQGLINKTESSEFGLFVSGGVPSWMVHNGRNYDVIEAGAPLLEPGRWHHVAGVADEGELRLYVDGELVGSRPWNGQRRANSLPLIIGADVDGQGRPTSRFPGQLDEVRVSNVARYAGAAFEPAAELGSDDDTVLYLKMDGHLGPWVRDASPTGTHPTSIGQGSIVAGER